MRQSGEFVPWRTLMGNSLCELCNEQDCTGCDWDGLQKEVERNEE